MLQVRLKFALHQTFQVSSKYNTSESMFSHVFHSIALSNTSISEFKQPIKLCANLGFVGLENSKYTLACWLLTIQINVEDWVWYSLRISWAVYCWFATFVSGGCSLYLHLVPRIAIYSRQSNSRAYSRNSKANTTHRTSLTHTQSGG